MPFDLTDPHQLALRAPAYELAFDQAGHALEAQQRTAVDLTARAGVLMAAAAVTTSFFGGQLLAHGHRSPAAWAALAAFLGVGLAVVHVLWPRHDWEFVTLATDILVEYVEPADVPIAVIHRDLAIHRSASFHRNSARIGRVSLSLRLGMALLVVEVVAWVASVSTLA